MNNNSETSIISNLFHFLTYQQVDCLKCGNYNLKYDQPISSIGLPIPNVHDINQNITLFEKVYIFLFIKFFNILC